MRSLRVLDTGVRPARWNIAVTAGLAQLHDAGKSPDTLRFHRYQRCVLLGLNQDARAVDASYCRTQGIEVGRRVTGGGAVYMSPGILAFDLILPARDFGHHLGRCVGRLLGALADAMSALGVATQSRPPGDLVIDGRKLCGTAGRFEGRTVVLQGTLLLDFDRAEMARSLRRPGDPLDEPKVTCLSEIMGEPPELARIERALHEAFAAALGRRVVPGALSAVETIATQSWLTEQNMGNAHDRTSPTDRVAPAASAP